MIYKEATLLENITIIIINTLILFCVIAEIIFLIGVKYE